MKIGVMKLVMKEEGGSVGVVVVELEDEKVVEVVDFEEENG